MSSSLPSPPEWDLLLSAAMKNDCTRIRHLITQENVPPSHANGVGQSALHVAALWANLEAVQTLLELGASVNATNHLTAATPMHMLLQSGRAPSLQRLEQIVDILLQYGADPTKMDRFGCLPVEYLLQSQQQQQSSESIHSLLAKLRPQTPKVVTLVEEGSASLEEFNNEWNAMDSTEQEALLDQVFRGGKTILALAFKQLVQQADEVMDANNHDDNHNNQDTAVLRLRQQFQIWNKLVLCGAKFPKAQGKDSILDQRGGEDPIDPPLAQALECLQKAYQKQQQPDATTTEVISILEETAKTVQTLTITTTTSSDDTNTNIITPGHEDLIRILHTAARKNNLLLLQFLITQLHWNVNAVNRQGMTALQFAARSGQEMAVQWLISSANANLFHQDHAGQTALIAATNNQKTNIVHMLTMAMNESNENKN